MPDVQSQTPDKLDQAAHPAANDPDALSRLYKMSTTSAGGGQEYVAINPTSIAALILGIASVLALLSGVLLVIPLAGFVCAIVSLSQIRGSNGTQAGRGFALGGLLLALGIGGVMGARQVIGTLKTRNDTQQIAELIRKLGQDLHLGRYDEAYDDLTTASFREKVTRQEFAAVFKQFETFGNYGDIESMEWNGEPMRYDTLGNSGVRTADAMALIHFRRTPVPGRPVLVLTDREGTWKVDAIPLLFKEKKKKKDLTVE